MAEAIQVASLMATISLRDNLTSGLESAKRGLSSFSDGISNVGGKLTTLGASMTALTAPLAGAFGGAVKAATSFQESMTNVQSVTQASQAEMDALSAKVLEIGTNSRYGGNEAAQAMYDIASGVADASSHMAILEASIKTAQAGSASLSGTTAALVSVMNSYSFSADKAGYASDVLSRTVAVGVGSMDEFAAALPLVTGYAKNLDISFADLGAQMAFLTTKGFSASQAATQLRAMMLAALNPNERMKKALAELGFQSGEAAIKQLGLVGAMKAISGTSVTASDGLAAVLGSSEALTGAMALMGDGAEQALSKFTTGLEGATAAAEAIQMQSAAAQMDLLKSQMENVAITVGEALLPVMNDVMKVFKPIIKSVMDWVKANPQLVKTIGLIVGALTVVGPLIAGVGLALTSIGSIIGVILSPIGLLIGGVVALYAAFESNFLGIRDFFQPVIDQVVGGIQTLFGVINNLSVTIENNGIGRGIAAILNAFAQMAGLVPDDAMFEPLLKIGDAIVTVFLTIRDAYNNLVKPALDAFGNMIVTVANTAKPYIEWLITQGFSLLASVMRDVVAPAIGIIAQAFSSVVTFISNVVTTIATFIQQNPEFVAALIGIVTATGLVAGAWFLLTNAGAILSGGLAILTGGVHLLMGALGILFSPIVIITAAMAALLWTINEFYPGGFSKLLSDAATSARQLGFIILFYLNSAVQWIRQRFEELIQTVQGVIDKIKEFLGLQGQANISGGIVPQNGVAPAMMPNIMSGGFASGGYTGDGPAGEVAGMVHRGEWVVPRGGALVMEGGGDTYNVTVYANSAAEGRAAADSFEQRIREIKNSRG